MNAVLNAEVEGRGTKDHWAYVRSGAVAGAVSAFVFTVIHDLFISDIWFSLPLMLAAGAICGLCVGWSYGLLFTEPSLGCWVRYNLLYVAAFVLLGVVSVAVFEPVTTIAALIAADEPPNALIARAMPMSVAFTLAMALALGLRYGRSWSHYGVILLTCTMLVLLLGLNVSVIGLVYIPSGAVYLVVEMFGLILALDAVYAGAFFVLERRRLVPVAQGTPSHI